MSGFERPDWVGMFVPSVSILESFLRGTATYFAILVLFRVVLKRQAGGIALPDLMLVVLVSECVSNALTAQATSITNGLVAVFALLFWSYAIDWLSYHQKWLQRVLEPPAIELIRDGKKVEMNLKREQITDEELAEQLRQSGVEEVSRVKLAMMESSGCVSVISAEDELKPAAKQNAVEPSDFAGAIARFLDAAKTLRAAVDYHEVQATEHRDAARTARGLLARYGVSGRKFLQYGAIPHDQ